MRIYFAPCGIGLGHVGRSVPIAKRLIEDRAEVAFSSYSDGISYIQREKLPLYRAPPIGFQVKSDGSIDFRLTAANPGPFVSIFTFLKQVNFELARISAFRPDIVVSDSRASSLLAARILRIPRLCILNQFQVMIPRRRRFLRLARLADYGTLTLIGKIWASQTVLIPDFPAPYTISEGNLHIPKAYRKRVRLVGPILPVDSESLPSKRELQNRLRLPEGKTCIFVPMSGPYKERAVFTENLKQILLSFPVDYEIIISLGYPQGTNEPLRQGNVAVYDWIPNRFEYLKACDLVIARAGHGTITQCMCYGKPAIFIPTPNHTEQLNNAYQASKLGVARVVRQEKITKAILLAAVKNMVDAGASDRAVALSKELSKYNGLKSAVNAIKVAAGK